MTYDILFSKFQGSTSLLSRLEASIHIFLETHVWRHPRYLRVTTLTRRFTWPRALPFSSAPARPQQGRETPSPSCRSPQSGKAGSEEWFRRVSSTVGQAHSQCIINCTQSKGSHHIQMLARVWLKRMVPQEVSHRRKGLCCVSKGVSVAQHMQPDPQAPIQCVLSREQRKGSAPGPFASLLLWSPCPRKRSHKGPHLRRKRFQQWNPERRTLLGQKGLFSSSQLPQSPAAGLQHPPGPPPLPELHQLSWDAVFLSPHFFIICPTIHTKINNIRDHHTPNH